MNLNTNFNDDTTLSQWWPIMHANLQLIQETYETINKSIETINGALQSINELLEPITNEGNLDFSTLTLDGNTLNNVTLNNPKLNELNIDGGEF